METYEKKYKEANAKIAARFGTNVAKEIFTDLYESEDEKIRKTLIEYFNAYPKDYYGELKKSYILAWLENIPITIDHEKREGFHLGYKACLEKQGEQKPFDYENANISQHDFAPKVEPKFHEGEWIVDNIGVAHQIERPVLIVANNTFGYDIVGGGYLDDDSDVHLWTIQDAKDGDVLAVDSKPFIYNGSKNEVTVGAYCGFNSEHKFSFAYNYVINQNITPATKEQRDLLFQKMKEAGYEWDFEKKELKKINKNTDVGHEYFSDLLEKDDCDNINDYAYQVAYCMSHDWIEETATWDDVQKACKLGAEWKEKHLNNSLTAWSEEDVNKPNGGIVMEDFNDGNGFYKVNLAYLNEEQVEEIEELVKRWDCQPKENEDDSIISDLLDYFEEDKCLKHEIVDIVEWLRTIKSQQKQRWSDNEKKMLCNLIVYLDNRKDLISEVKDTYVSWLKSLKNRVQPIHEYSDTERQEMFIKSQRPHFWKPSDQQMKALKYVAYHLMPDNNYREEMFSLYEDLKKLKGE